MHACLFVSTDALCVEPALTTKKRGRGRERERGRGREKNTKKEDREGTESDSDKQNNNEKDHHTPRTLGDNAIDVAEELFFIGFAVQILLQLSEPFGKGNDALVQGLDPILRFGDALVQRLMRSHWTQPIHPHEKGRAFQGCDATKRKHEKTHQNPKCRVGNVHVRWIQEKEREREREKERERKGVLRFSKLACNISSFSTILLMMSGTLCCTSRDAEAMHSSSASTSSEMSSKCMESVDFMLMALGFSQGLRAEERKRAASTAGEKDAVTDDEGEEREAGDENEDSVCTGEDEDSVCTGVDPREGTDACATGGMPGLRFIVLCVPSYVMLCSRAHMLCSSARYRAENEMQFN